METMPFGIVLLLMTLHSFHCLAMEKLEDVLVYPAEPTSNDRKRETKTTLKRTEKNFIEEKLIQHTQALEHLVKLVQSNEDMTKSLIENLSKFAAEPKLPEKVEVHHQSRRSNDDNDLSIVRLGKQIPKYGILIKDMVLKQMRDVSDPIPIVEQEDDSVELEFLSRRSFNGPPEAVPSLQSNKAISPWCSVAMLCHRTVNPVCGYDDNFGYGKFDDICHMLQVNCYWKYNFVLVPSCRPSP